MKHYLDAEYGVMRYIVEYDNQTEELVREHALRSFDLEAFRLAFSESEPGNSMYACYLIQEQHVEFLKPHLLVQVDWDFKGRAYFVEACAAE